MNNLKIILILVFSFSLSFGLSLNAGEWVIVADALSFSKTQIVQTMETRRVVALDGASDNFRRFNLVPHVILGDFDSIKDKSFWGIKQGFNGIDQDSSSYNGNSDVLIVPAKDQTRSDLEKGIRYCDENNATSIHILNATGGRTDHTLNNFSLLKKYYNPSRPIIILTEHERIEYIQNKTYTINGEIGAQVAIIGFPLAHMTTTGLTYNGTDFKCELGDRNSPCNTLASTEAVIQVRGGAIVISQKHSGDAYKRNMAKL